MATTKQVLSVVGVLIQNLDEKVLEELDGEMLHRSIIRNGPEAGRQFGLFLQNYGCVIVRISQWKVWRTFQVGGKSKEQLIESVERSGSKVSAWAQDMMKQKKFKVSPRVESVDFAKVQVKDLGFTEMPTTDELYARALGLGLDLCLPDDAPVVREQYKDQPKEEVIWFAMKQISDSVGNPNIFKLNRFDVDLWLHGGLAHPVYRWLLGDVFVFRLRKLSSSPAL